MFLASMNPDYKLEPTAAVLRTKEVSDLTWDYVATSLIDEYNARKSNGCSSTIKGKHKNKLKLQIQEFVDGNHSDISDLKTTVKVFAAALGAKSNKAPDSKCDFCGKDGHTADR